MRRNPPSATAVRRADGQESSRAFTLVELLTAMTVLVTLIVVMAAMTDQTNKVWRGSRARIVAFQQARNAFERVTTNLRQSTLNTYLDYYDTSGRSRTDLLRQTQTDHPGDAQAFSNAAAGFLPVNYDRASELQFVCGPSEDGDRPLIKLAGGTTGTRPTHALFFQCPIGHVSDPDTTTNDYKNLTRVLNAVGYYVEFANGNNAALGQVPKFIANPLPAWRYRLMELNQPSQNLSVYSPGVSYVNPNAWFSMAVDPAASPTPTFVVGENVVALIVRPKVANPVPNAAAPTEIAPSYAYDTKQYLSVPSALTKLSKNQLPPLVQVTLVAIDADSAGRLASQYGNTPPPLVDSTLFADVTKYSADLSALEATLQSKRLTYRTFVTDVSLPTAKWSETH